MTTTLDRVSAEQSTSVFRLNLDRVSASQAAPDGPAYEAERARIIDEDLALNRWMRLSVVRPDTVSLRTELVENEDGTRELVMCFSCEQGLGLVACTPELDLGLVELPYGPAGELPAVS